MPEPLDRSAFLQRVADAVDLQPADVAEVLEELNAHLDDAAEGWREAGLEPTDAERRALRSLGDPSILGRELGSARHRTRHLFAAVGGGILSSLTFGIWAYLTLWLIGGGLALVGGYIAWWVLTALGGSAAGWFSGPVGSAGTVIIWTLWFAWLGWVLPGRVARSARRSVRGVQRAVGLAGFVIGSLLLWTWVSVDLDPILAVGLPLGPFAFLLATLRPSHVSSLFPPTQFRTRAGIAVAVIVGSALVGLLTVDTKGHGSMSGGWDPGLAGLGTDPMADPVLASMSLLPNPGISIEAQYGSGGLQPGAAVVGGVTFADDAGPAMFERQFTALELEILPASVVLPTADGRGGITLQGGPIAAASVALPAADLGSAVRLDVPTLRTRTQLVTVLLGRRGDGTHVVLGFDTSESPAWHGTLFDWWFTRR